MRDLKLLDAAAIDPLVLDENDLKWMACRGALRIFKENSLRTARMIEAPVYSAYMADVHRMALHRVFGKEPTIAECEERNDSIGDEMHKIMHLLINISIEDQRQALIVHTSNLNQFIQNTSDIHTVFESLLNAMLIQAWTAFEVLVKQLLLEAVKQHPECFAHLSGNEKFTFQKREAFRKSYKTAFDSNGSIQTKLHDQSIDALSEIRNLLVHNAGVVDQPFIERCRKMNSPAWAALPLNQAFQCTGAAVRSLIDANSQCGVQLIKRVDKWLTTHSPK